MVQRRRRFTSEFKIEAVRLAAGSDKGAVVIARELGVRPDMLRKWRRQYAQAASAAAAFPGNGKVTSQDEELRRVKRELEVVRQERDFLRKAAAYFAKESR